MTRVLDTHALMVFLEKEPGYEKVKGCFVEAVETQENLLMTSVNFGEMCYIVLREYGQKMVDQVESLVRTLPVEIVDVDILLAKEAARFKAANSISYADCFAAALAKMRGGEVLTGDREFKKVEKETNIQWI